MDELAILAKSQDLNFVAKFSEDMHNLLALLGKTEVETVAPGTAHKIYKVTGTLDEGDVGEKELIPDSAISVGTPTLIEINYKKYRNLTSIEEIGRKGYDLAVGETNDFIRRQIRKRVRKTIFTAIKKGTGTAQGNTFQATVADAAKSIVKLYEDEDITPVFFASPDDLYDYLGTHEVGLAQNFGLSYLANFLGIGDIIVDTNIDKGQVFATAKENLKVLAADIKSIPGMELTTDESGIIGVHNGAKYENAALETVAYTGLGVQPIYLNRIVKASLVTG